MARTASSPALWAALRALCSSFSSVIALSTTYGGMSQKQDSNGSWVRKHGTVTEVQRK